MSDAIQQAITAMEWMLCDYEHLNTMGQPLSANWPQRVQAVKDAIAGLQAAQAQAGDVEEVNQQLLEALEAAMNFIDSHAADPDITQEMVENYAALKKTKPYEAIAAAQEAGNE